MYGNLKLGADGLRRETCPECGEEMVVQNDKELTVVKACEHATRRWRVTADRRVRVEFRKEVARV